MLLGYLPKTVKMIDKYDLMLLDFSKYKKLIIDEEVAAEREKIKRAMEDNDEFVQLDNLEPVKTSNEDDIDYSGYSFLFNEDSLCDSNEMAVLDLHTDMPILVDQDGKVMVADLKETIDFIQEQLCKATSGLIGDELTQEERDAARKTLEKEFHDFIDQTIKSKISETEIIKDVDDSSHDYYQVSDVPNGPWKYLRQNKQTKEWEQSTDGSCWVEFLI